MAKGFWDFQLLSALLNTAHFYFLGLFHILSVSFFGRYTMTLLSPTFWNLWLNLNFTFTASYDYLPRLPCRDAISGLISAAFHSYEGSFCNLLHMLLTLTKEPMVKTAKFCCSLDLDFCRNRAKQKTSDNNDIPRFIKKNWLRILYVCTHTYNKNWLLIWDCIHGRSWREDICKEPERKGNG